MKLSEVPQNKTFAICQINGPELIVERLSELGLYIGKQVQLIGQSPFSGPLIIRSGSQVVALRIEEAKCIIVKTL